MTASPPWSSRIVWAGAAAFTYLDAGSGQVLVPTYPFRFGAPRPWGTIQDLQPGADREAGAAILLFSCDCPDVGRLEHFSAAAEARLLKPHTRPEVPLLPPTLWRWAYLPNWAILLQSR